MNRDLFRSALDDEPFAELRMALNQNQPIGNDRFYREIEVMTGQRRGLRKTGRPRNSNKDGSTAETEQSEFLLIY